jgi:hypothetical protein
MGIINFASLGVILYKDQTGLAMVYVSSLVFFVGMEITNATKVKK